MRSDETRCVLRQTRTERRLVEDKEPLEQVEKDSRDSDDGGLARLAHRVSCATLVGLKSSLIFHFTERHS